MTFSLGALLIFITSGGDYSVVFVMDGTGFIVATAVSNDQSFDMLLKHRSESGTAVRRIP